MGRPPLLHTARSKASREITEITTSRISGGTVERSITAMGLPSPGTRNRRARTSLIVSCTDRLPNMKL